MTISSSYTTQQTNELLDQQRIELLVHSLYSPDQGPDDFLTFPKIRNSQRGEWVHLPEELVKFLKMVISTED